MRLFDESASLRSTIGCQGQRGLGITEEATRRQAWLKKSEPRPIIDVVRETSKSHFIEDVSYHSQHLILHSVRNYKPLSWQG